jgi:hypothetical protein
METGQFWQIDRIGAFDVFIERYHGRFEAYVLAARSVTAEGATLSEVKERMRELLDGKTSVEQLNPIDHGT